MDEHRKTPAPDRKNQPKRLLLVADSDVANLLYTSRLLEQFDYMTCMARTAKETLEMAMIAVPALIIISLDLKDMNSEDLIRNLKRNPMIATVPLIALQHQDGLVGEKSSLTLEACDCLQQPVAPENLFLAVQAAIETRPRTNIRVRANLPVRMFNMPHAGMESALTLDLSERGMFVQHAQPADKNKRLFLHVNLHGEIISVEARVIYSNRTPGGLHLKPGMGLEFVQITPTSQELIRRFIRTEIIRGIENMYASQKKKPSLQRKKET